MSEAILWKKIKRISKLPWEVIPDCKGLGIPDRTIMFKTSTFWVELKYRESLHNKKSPALPIKIPGYKPTQAHWLSRNEAREVPCFLIISDMKNMILFDKNFMELYYHGFLAHNYQQHPLVEIDEVFLRYAERRERADSV